MNAHDWSKWATASATTYVFPPAHSPIIKNHNGLVYLTQTTCWFSPNVTFLQKCPIKYTFRCHPPQREHGGTSYAVVLLVLEPSSQTKVSQLYLGTLTNWEERGRQSMQTPIWTSQHKCLKASWPTHACVRCVHLQVTSKVVVQRQGLMRFLYTYLLT